MVVSKVQEQREIQVAEPKKKASSVTQQLLELAKAALPMQQSALSYSCQPSLANSNVALLTSSMLYTPSNLIFNQAASIELPVMSLSGEGALIERDVEKRWEKQFCLDQFNLDTEHTSSEIKQEFHLV